VLAACGVGPGARSQAAQDRDAQTIAQAIQNSDHAGSRFTMDNQLVFTGGTIPSGQQEVIQSSTRTGSFKDGAAAFDNRFTPSQLPELDVVVDESRLFLRHHNAKSWNTLPANAAAVLMPLARLATIRETVLLAKSISAANVSYSFAGAYRHYQITAAKDQLEQLEGVSFTSDASNAEATFLRSAAVRLDVYLTMSDSKLARLSIHIEGTDPQGKTVQTIDSSLVLQPGSVRPIQIPASATTIQPADIFK
jgi:hypothetical protein